ALAARGMYAASERIAADLLARHLGRPPGAEPARDLPRLAVDVVWHRELQDGARMRSQVIRPERDPLLHRPPSDRARRVSGANGPVEQREATDQPHQGAPALALPGLVQSLGVGDVDMQRREEAIERRQSVVLDPEGRGCTGGG